MNLESFLIRNVQLPEQNKRLGAGSYGSVEELDVGGITCAGKTLHSELIDTANVGVDAIAERFVQECQLMSQLRHPHVVQFLGVCFRSQSPLPILVMEYLPTNLDCLIEKYPSIPLCTKRSIAYDISVGLAYLHNHSPPVIHRDLTARNVLLTTSMVAKIADFGNSRIVDISPDQLAKTMTCVPGTLMYLPPEALDPKPTYDTKLDIFSFGHLFLYLMVQEFPVPSHSTYMNPDTKVIVGRSEVERRQSYIEKLDVDVTAFKTLVIKCLDNDPDKRPSTQELCQTLKDLGSQAPDPFQEAFKLDLILRLAIKESNGEAHDRNDASLPEDMTSEQYKSEIIEIKSLCQTKDKLLEAREIENKQQVSLLKSKSDEIETLQSTIKNLEDLCITKDSIIQIKETEYLQKIKSLQNDIEILQSRTKSVNEQHTDAIKGKEKEFAMLQKQCVTKELEIEGLERVCQAKDMLVKVKEEEKQMLQEKLASKLEKMGISPDQLYSEAEENTDVDKTSSSTDGSVTPNKTAASDTSEKAAVTDDESSSIAALDVNKIIKSLPKELCIVKCTEAQRDYMKVLKKMNKRKLRLLSSNATIKVTAVGDGATGKTCLLMTFVNKRFPDEYIPTVFDNYVASLNLPGSTGPCTLGLWDTAGQEDYDRLRPLSYPETDVALICFSQTSPASFINVNVKWIPEIQQFSPYVPFLLVGLKADLRNDPKTCERFTDINFHPITKIEGQAIAEYIGAYAYVECSAVTGEGLRNVFEEAVYAAFAKRRFDYKQNLQKKKCTIQ